MLNVMRVKGRSMIPALFPYEFVVVINWPFMRFGLNDIVVIDTPQFGRVIKRICGAQKQARFRVAGDNKFESVTETELGWISRNQLKGKVVWVSRP